MAEELRKAGEAKEVKLRDDLQVSRELKLLTGGPSEEYGGEVGC